VLRKKTKKKFKNTEKTRPGHGYKFWYPYPNIYSGYPQASWYYLYPYPWPGLEKTSQKQIQYPTQKHKQKNIIPNYLPLFPSNRCNCCLLLTNCLLLFCLLTLILVINKTIPVPVIANITKSKRRNIACPKIDSETGNSCKPKTDWVTGISSSSSSSSPIVSITGRAEILIIFKGKFSF